MILLKYFDFTVLCQYYTVRNFNLLTQKEGQKQINNKHKEI